MIIIRMRGKKNMVSEVFACVCEWVCACAYWLCGFLGSLCPNPSFAHLLSVCYYASLSFHVHHFPSSVSLCFIISFYFIFILWLIFISIQINPHSLSCLFSSLSFPAIELVLVLIHYFFGYHILLYTKLFFFLATNAAFAATVVVC